MSGDWVRAMPGMPSRPWPRQALSPESWLRLGATPGVELLAMWGEAHAVHALWRDGAGPIAVTVGVADGAYPALSPYRPGAVLFERAIGDLWGHAASGAVDARPWLDHGRWEVAAPLSPRPGPRAGAPGLTEFLALPGDGEEQVPIGPLAGMAEVGQFRLFLRGGRIVRAEARLGWLHRGVPALMRGRSARAAAPLAARLSGAAPVAHAIAFARAAEAASDIAPPARAVALRAVMAEMERAASHLGDIAGLAEAAGMPLAAGPCLMAREALLRAAAHGFGHRLMMDAVVPGGVAAELSPAAEDGLRAAAGALGAAVPGIAGLCEPLARRLEGVGAGPVAGLAPGGPAGRAMGRDCDLRRGPGYPPYRELAVPPPGDGAGDAAARLGVWLTELRDSARMLRGLLAALPGGEVLAALPQASGEGFGCAEGARGDIWTWVRLEAGQVAGVFARDPGWLHVPLLEAAGVGAEVAEWGTIRASFGLSHAGVDL